MSLRRFLFRRPAPAASVLSAATQHGPPPPPPVFLRFRSSTVFIVAVISFAIFTDIFLYGLIVPVMPFALTARAGVAEDQVQRWNAILIACYGIALFVGSPVAGFYADHTSSRRLPLLVGLVALAGATILLCVGRSVGVFVVGRLLQGASAAVVWSVGLALLADTMGRRIGLAMGYVSISLSAGLLLSPLIGGAVYAGEGYYAVYYVAFGLIVLDIVLRLLLVEKKVARRWIKDLDEAASVRVDEENPAPADIPRLSQGPQQRQKQEIEQEQKRGGVENNGEPANAETATSTDSEREKTDARQEEGADRVFSPIHLEPIPPATTAQPPHQKTSAPRRVWILLRSRRLMAALLGCVIQAAIMIAFDTVLPLFVQSTFSWSSTAAGLLFFALYIPPAVLGPVVGILGDRWGAKWLSLFGFLASVPLLVCLRFVDHDTISQKVLLGALLALMGVMLTLSNVPLMAEISFAIEAEEARQPGVFGDEGVYGMGYGLFTTSFALGSSLGSLLAGYLHADFGWATMAWSLAILCAIGTVVVALWVGEFRVRPHLKPDHQQENPTAAGGA